MDQKRPLKIIIIGAGPTALGALYRLHQLKDANNKHSEVLILEQESEAGGLARSITDSNGFTWDLGIHVTGASKYAEFVKVLDETIPEWNNVKRCVKADMRHILSPEDIHSSTPTSSKDEQREQWEYYVPYPVQNSIPYFGRKLQEKCMNELEAASTQIETDEKSETLNFADFSKRIFGTTLQNAFIRPYNEKVWTVTLEEMSSSWVEGRVPRIDYEMLRRRCELSRFSRQQLIEQDTKRDQTYFRLIF